MKLRLGGSDYEAMKLRLVTDGNVPGAMAVGSH